MELIVAVSRNWGIGKGGELLFSIPEDMKFFRAATQGKTVVMGRKTLDSLPGGRPLKNRRNIVLTRDPDLQVEGAEVYCTGAEVRLAVAGESGDRVLVMGGAQIYRLFLDDCDRAYVTRVDADADADSFFPNLDDRDDWTLEQQSDEKEYNGLHYRFCTYVRRPRGE